MIHKSKLTKFILFIAISLILGCSDDNLILLDKIDAISLVNPEISQIFQDGGIQKAYFTKDNEIIILTENSLVFTSDLFQNLSFNSIGYINLTKAPTITEESIIFDNEYFGLYVQVFNKQGGVFTINIQKSNSWYQSNPTVTNPGILRDGAFINENTGWILNNKDDGKLIVEKYDNGSIKEIFEFPFNDGRIVFYDNELGYILFAQGYFSSYYSSPGNVYLSTTTNGGLDWTEPKQIGNNIDIWDIQMLSRNSIAIKHDYEYNQYYTCTSDGGLTWNTVNIPNGFTLEQIVSSDLALIKDSYNLYLFNANNETVINDFASPIKNQSWNFSGSFITSETGIIYNESEMYITYDNGQNWGMLVYPYDYLTN